MVHMLCLCWHMFNQKIILPSNPSFLYNYMRVSRVIKYFAGINHTLTRSKSNLKFQRFDSQRFSNVRKSRSRWLRRYGHPSLYPSLKKYCDRLSKLMLKSLKLGRNSRFAARKWFLIQVSTVPFCQSTMAARSVSPARSCPAYFFKIEHRIYVQNVF